MSAEVRVPEPAVRDGKVSCKRPGHINLTDILRWRKKGEEFVPTGDAELDRIGRVIYDGPKERDVFDYVVRNGTGVELIRFHFKGPGNLKIIPGKKVAQGLVHGHCPQCGHQTPVIFLETKEKFIGRTTGEEIETTRLRKATIHCGQLLFFTEN